MHAFIFFIVAEIVITLFNVWQQYIVFLTVEYVSSKVFLDLLDGLNQVGLWCENTCLH
jgi:hypothetical protein